MTTVLLIMTIVLTLLCILFSGFAGAMLALAYVTVQAAKKVEEDCRETLAQKSDEDEEKYTADY